MRPLVLAMSFLVISLACGEDTGEAPSEGPKLLVATVSFQESLPIDEERTFRDAFVNSVQVLGGGAVTAKDINIVALDTGDARTEVEFEVDFNGTQPAFQMKNALLSEDAGSRFVGVAKGPATIEEVKVHEKDEISDAAEGYVAMAAVLAVMFCLVITICVVNVGVMVCCLCRPGRKLSAGNASATVITTSQAQPLPAQKREMLSEPDQQSRSEPA